MDDSIKEFVKVFQSNKYRYTVPDGPMFCGIQFNKLYVLYCCSIISAWGDCDGCPFCDKDHILIDDSCRTIAMGWAAKEIERLQNEVAELSKSKEVQ